MSPALAQGAWWPGVLLVGRRLLLLFLESREPGCERQHLGTVRGLRGEAK